MQLKMPSEIHQEMISDREFTESVQPTIRKCNWAPDQF